MRIKELKDGMTKVELDAKVVSVEPGREVTTKFGTNILLRRAVIEDETGSISLTLWGPEPKISEGDNIHIDGGVVKKFREELQLSLGRGGTIEVKEAEK